MDGVLPLEKGQFVPSVSISHMLHRNNSNFCRKLRLIESTRPDLLKRHSITFGPAGRRRYSLDRIMTVVMLIDYRRINEIDLLVSTLECLERSNNEQFVKDYILDFYKSFDVRPEGLPYAAD